MWSLKMTIYDYTPMHSTVILTEQTFFHIVLVIQ